MPFPGKLVPEIIARVKQGKLTPPRAVLPSIPPPLEAICLKAMAFEPADGTGRRESWPTTSSTGSPTSRWPPIPSGGSSGLARWLRRHRTWTYAAAAALVGITLVATVALVLVNGARQQRGSGPQPGGGEFQDGPEGRRQLPHERQREPAPEGAGHARHPQPAAGNCSSPRCPFYEEFVNKRSQDPKLREQLAKAYVPPRVNHPGHRDRSRTR